MFFSTTFTNIAVLTGYFLLGVGVAAVFFVPSARVWGKRHLFLLGAVILVASSAWAGAVGTNYDSFLAARVIQGVGCSPFETLVNVAVGDLYPVHQRGLRMAFTNLAVFGGAFFTPILVGRITRDMGWEWTFYLTSIFCAVMLLAVFLLCPETAYRRDMALNTDIIAEDQTGTRDPVAVSGNKDAEKGRGLEPSFSADAPTTSRPIASRTGDAFPPRKSYLQSLSPFDGRKTSESYLDLLLRPFPLLLHPAFLWGCLIQGTMIAWTVFIGVIVAAVFLGPPFFWNEVEAGYAYTGAFVGALAGFAIAGAFSDWSAKYLTRRNGGVYEPEFRIVMVLPMFVVGGIGLYGFALTAGGLLSGRFHYAVPLVFFGFEVAGMVIGAVASSLYIVDAYRKSAVALWSLLGAPKLASGLTVS